MKIADLFSPASSINTSDRRRWPLLWSIMAYLGIGLLLLTVALYSVDRTEKRLLAQTAEHTAIQYAQYIARIVPDLDRLFTQRELTVEAHTELRRTRQLGDVFRFKLFDPNGKSILVSDDLDSATPLLSADISSLGAHHSNSNTHVADIVLGGNNYIELADGREKIDRPDLYSEVYVPLKGETGLHGVIEVYVDQTARQEGISTAFADVAVIVTSLLLLGMLGLAVQAWRRLIDRQRGDEKIRYMAEHDILSGALNRASFERILTATVQAEAESGSGFAVHCIDLDRFKEVNDTFGHLAGDEVLLEVAGRLKSLCQPGDVLARLGGDEFAMLQAASNCPRDVEAYGVGIVKALAVPMEIEGNRIPGGGSVGAACYTIDATDISELLHKADLAMYRSKTSGRGRFSFYDEALDRELEDRRLLTIDLRTALADGSLSLHYQPLFDSSECENPVGYEALMRWNHPTRGNVPPTVFIPLAEECGEIEALGTWAIGQACQDAAAWADGVHVAVNLSPAQFRDSAEDVISVVARALEKTGLDPNQLELEITESLLISNPEQVLESLNGLSSLGVRISMDDFGTGYSSLSYLWRFPFNKVKIDRAFVKELEDEDKVSVIIASIVSLAHSLGMRVNAEGVETASQRDALRLLGCDELQGFLLGRPAPLQLDEDEDQNPLSRAA